MNVYVFSRLLLAYFTYIAAAGWCHAQANLFSEVQPVYDPDSGTWGHFPALKDMRSAWGDVDGDGDFDVILMGEGPSGPQTLFFQNEGSAAFPFAFALRQTGVPHLQDGGLSWGDMDNDGDLDLAITGSVRSEPSGPADLRAHVFRNDGQQPSGRWNFTEIGLGPAFTGCYRGAVSWGDIDNDGDQDLFVSGDTSLNYRAKFSRIYRNDGIPNFALLSEFPGMLARRVVWWDFNRDSFADLVVTTDNQVGGPEDSADYGKFSHILLLFDPYAGRHQVVLDIHGLIPGDTSDWWGTTGTRGPVGDWDGDGGLDLFRGDTELLTQKLSWFSGEATTNFTEWHGVTDSLGIADLVSSDLLNEGRDQWLLSYAYGNPRRFFLGRIRLRINGVGRFSLEELEHDVANVRPRYRGVLDAVDVNRDGVLDLFHSGYDLEDTLQNGDPVTGSRFYRNNWGITNTPPSAPAGLVADATPQRVRFRWNSSTDAQTGTPALRYAVSLRHESGAYYLQPGATSAGLRLKPGLDGTSHATEFLFNVWRRGNGAVLPDGTYSWSVQAVDSGGMGSPFAPEQTFTIGDGPPPPDTGERRAEIPWQDTAVDVSDVDGDGDLDVALAGHTENGMSGGTAVRRNDGAHPSDPGSHVFAGTASGLPPLEAGAVRWADVDGDGDVDLAMSGRSLGQAITRVYRNNGGVMEIRNMLEGVEQSALDWGDFDNDGDLDLVVTGYREGVPRTRLYRNGGDLNQWPGQLVPQASTLPDFGRGAVAWGDYDHDGDLDLLLCGDTQTYSLTGGTVPCVPPPLHLRPPGTHYMCSSTTAGQTPLPKTTLFRNDGLATGGIHANKWRFTPVFAEFPPFLSYTEDRAVTARAEWCDLSGDGYPDLVLGGMEAFPGSPGYGTPAAKVFRNAGAGPGLGEWLFLPGQDLLVGVFDHALQTLTCADWNGDGRPDVLLGGWINSPGTVPLQLVHNDSMNFTRRTYLRTTDSEGTLQFAGGLAAFGHFDGDANVDVAFAGRWGIQGIGGQGNHGTAGRIFLNSPTAGNSPPTVPTGLAATVSGGGTEVTFSWERSFDNGLQPVLPSYNLHVERVDGRPGGMPGMADLATGKRRVSRTGNAGHHLSWTLRNLPAGEYRWAVQAIDAALAPSLFATAAQTITVGPPVVPVITPLGPLQQWVAVHPAVSAVDYLGLAAGRDARLAVGRRGQVMLSRRQGLFTAVESGVFTDLHDILIDAEGALAVGQSGVIRTSSDGVVWTESPSGTTATLRAIARGADSWVAGGNDVLLRSTDRRAWTPVPVPAGTVVEDVAWAQGRYVAAGWRSNAKVLLTSTDGLAWTDVTPAGLLAGKLTGVVGTESSFIAVGGSAIIGGGLTYHSDVLSSSNGLVWTSAMNANLEPMSRVISNAEGWFAVREREIRRSLGGSLWETVFGDSFARMSAVSVDDGRITMAGLEGLIFDAPMAGLSTTADWTQRSGANPVQAAYFDFSHIEALGNTVVAVGSGGLDFHSLDDGVTWTRGTDGSFNGYYDLAVGAGRFVRTFREGIESSADGVTWEKANVRDTRALVFGNGRFLAARDTGGFMLSNDGRAWTEASPTTPWCTALAFGNGRFLAREAWTGSVHTSTDGINWTSASQVASSGLFHYARDRFFSLSAGFPGVISSSFDGATWQPLVGAPAGSFTQAVWHRDRYVFIGEPTLASTDLINWTLVPVPAGAVTAGSVTGRLIVAGAGQALLFSPDSPPPSPTAAPTLGINSNPAPNVFLFTLSGTAGQLVTLQRSTNLQSWTTVDTFMLSGGAEILEVAAPDAHPAWYFRLQWSP